MFESNAIFFHTQVFPPHDRAERAMNWVTEFPLQNPSYRNVLKLKTTNRLWNHSHDKVNLYLPKRFYDLCHLVSNEHAHVLS